MKVLLAIECAGATPLTRFASPDYLVRLLAHAPLQYLSEWDHHRGKLLATVDRILVLGSTHPDLSSVSTDALHEWRHAMERLTVIEEERRIPIVVAGIPSLLRAHQSGCTLEALEDAEAAKTDTDEESIRQRFRRYQRREERRKARQPFFDELKRKIFGG